MDATQQADAVEPSPADALQGTDIDPRALTRYIEEQIYSLPGITGHRREFSILLTGSRAIGRHTPGSDVDLDVVCPLETYEAVHRAAHEAGIIDGQRGFFCVLAGEDWQRYYGREMARPHYSVTPLSRVEQQFREYDDVALWIWSNARILTDPGGRFQRILVGFQGYPKDVLVRKIQYHWLYAGYAGVDIYPHHHTSDTDLLPALAAITTMVSELLRLFCLLEGKPFPYTERLMGWAETTALGREFGPLLRKATLLAAGRACPEMDAWERLDQAIEVLLSEDRSPEARALQQACARAAVAAGVDTAWVEADYDNIDELLWGELGPVP